MLSYIQEFDCFILLFIQDHIRINALNSIMVIFSSAGNYGFIWIAICLILYSMKKYRKVAVTALVSMAVCIIINDLIVKNIVCRPRPFETLDSLSILVKAPASYSFPSGHACSSFAASTTFFTYFHKKSTVFFILAALISFSRLYVGVHYPSDVLVGLIIGVSGGHVISRKLKAYFDKEDMNNSI